MRMRLYSGGAKLSDEARHDESLGVFRVQLYGAHKENQIYGLDFEYQHENIVQVGQFRDRNLQ